MAAGQYSMHQQGFVWLPALCRGLHLRRVSGSPIGARPQRCPLKQHRTAGNTSMHFLCARHGFAYFYHLLVFSSSQRSFEVSIIV